MKSEEAMWRAVASEWEMLQTETLDYRAEMVDHFTRFGELIAQEGDLTHGLAMLGDVRGLRRLAAKGFEMDVPDYKGRRPLVHAASYGNTDTMRFLLAEGAAVECEVDEAHGTPLEHAAGSNPEAVRLMLEAGADPNRNRKDKVGDNPLYITTPLHYAALLGRLEVIRLLLEAGADIDATNYAGKTALHFAAGEEHPEAVRVLLQAGADADKRDDAGRTALDLARQTHYPATVHALTVGRETPERRPVEATG